MFWTFIKVFIYSVNGIFEDLSCFEQYNFYLDLHNLDLDLKKKGLMNIYLVLNITFFFYLDFLQNLHLDLKLLNSWMSTSWLFW